MRKLAETVNQGWLGAQVKVGMDGHFVVFIIQTNEKNRFGSGTPMNVIHLVHPAKPSEYLPEFFRWNARGRHQTREVRGPRNEGR